MLDKKKEKQNFFADFIQDKPLGTSSFSNYKICAHICKTNNNNRQQKLFQNSLQRVMKNQALFHNLRLFHKIRYVKKLDYFKKIENQKTFTIPKAHCLLDLLFFP